MAKRKPGKMAKGGRPFVVNLGRLRQEMALNRLSERIKRRVSRIEELYLKIKSAESTGRAADAVALSLSMHKKKLRMHMSMKEYFELSLKVAMAEKAGSSALKVLERDIKGVSGMVEEDQKQIRVFEKRNRLSQKKGE